MDALLLLLIITAATALFGMAATTFGVDTRDGFR